MAKLPQAFDVRSVAPASSEGGSSLPVGDHPAVIIGSEFKQVKDSPNEGYLELTLNVIDGPNKGATGQWRLNLYNNNPKAVEIAYKQMSAIGHVTGVYNIDDTSALHGKPFIVVVRPQTDPKYTEVKGVKNLDGSEPGKAGQGPVAAQPQAAAAPAPAWGAAAPAQAPAQPPAQAWAAPAQPQATPVQAGGWNGAPAPVSAPAAAPAQAWGGAPAAGAPATPPWGQR